MVQTAQSPSAITQIPHSDMPEIDKSIHSLLTQKMWMFDEIPLACKLPITFLNVSAKATQASKFTLHCLQSNASGGSNQEMQSAAL